ncbi:C45 family autoproteolytic acyltransferase/hydolase [Flavobacterium cellulosilyticum]|uniref:Acyl-CoA--6-aminopenicillanic acid acyltransferase n=1 Tax=Flavobacterium cellulosilyticum TaxID=2541731 RepID=A0A4R5CCW6_9FLAO|nr:C45 family peptidase [Flavobacterium cellulosilyticum]TDD97305.1 acyl-CoA--6-aminopenicillanic acid acyltransferase [Flavobacterium cellulosilyticum]
MQLHYNTISEPDVPGLKWKKLFDTFWPAYHAWLVSKDAAYFPDLHASQEALKKYMPKMWPTYLRLCKLSNGDQIVANFLTGFNPPAYICACSQAVMTKNTVQLVRNYDYHPNLFEGNLVLSSWNGKKVIATSDCLIGAIDGMNEDGLAISLTFGGSKVVGMGFGIPFILRYVLEFCSNVEEAVEELMVIPAHMSCNVTVIDKSGNFKTILLSPERDPIVTDDSFTTNHQETIDWPENAKFNKTIERSVFIKNLLLEKNLSANKMTNAFLKPPLYNTLFNQGFGTLYTAVYNPIEGSVQIRWPQDKIVVSFNDFTEEYKHIEFNLHSNEQINRSKHNNI